VVVIRAWRFIVKKVLSCLLLSMVLVAVMLPLGAVVAQDGEPQRGGRLELVALNDPRTLDSNQAVDTIEYNTVAGALFEGLYHFTPEGELVAALADGLPEVSEDGLVYTFTIKPGAMFAGPDFSPRAVTAADVAYGMTRALDPTPDGAPAPSWGSGYLFPIKGAAAFNAGETQSVEGIEVIDDDTLQVTLEAPTTTFLLGLTIATSWPVPPEVVAERGEDFGNRPVGAGPFYLKEWNKGSDLTLARNEGYVDPELPYLDEIHVDLGVDENTQVLRLESGEADGAFEPFSIGPVGLRTLAEAEGVTVEDSVGPRIYYLALENGGILGDKDLRLAVAHAVTRDFTRQFGNLAKPWNQLMGSTTLQSDPEGTRVYPYDPEQAAAYLESGGYDGTPLKVIYDVGDPYGEANATALRQDLEAVGFTVELNGLQTGQFFTDVYDPAARDLSSTYWSADYPDLQDYISTNFVCGSFLNISNFCDEDIDQAFFETESMAFGPERDAALLEVQQRLIDEVAGIPVMEVAPQVVYGERVGAMPTLATYAPYDWKRAWVKADG
jgi:peptide/nickel transport system substrate-binding protein/oligopeptide transport system substrate-binding protein